MFLIKSAVFNQRHLDWSVAHVYVQDLVDKSEETNSVANTKLNASWFFNETTQIAMNISLSTWQLCDNRNITGIGSEGIENL